MISIVCWQWIGHDQRRRFELEEVNRLQRGFKRFLSLPHRFIVVSDNSKGLSKDVEWLRTPEAALQWAHLQSPQGIRFPSCYRRLWAFSKEATILGERILTTDIDAVPVAQLDPLFDYAEDFVGWRPARDWGTQKRFGGGNFLLRTGTRTDVWDSFNGQSSIMAARRARYMGSDQAWISYKLAEKERAWPQDCGIYSVRDMGASLELPKGARLIHFNGVKKPWQYARHNHGPGSWVRDYWQ